MSLDFDLNNNGEYVFSGNMTHNVTNMWAEAGVYSALYETNGMSAFTITNILAHGICDMMFYPEKYKAMDSPNGWGLYENALPFLTEIYKACLEYPEAKIEIFS